MKRKQWFVLAWGCLIIGCMFIGLDMMHSGCVDLVIASSSDAFDNYNAWCLAQSEIMEPFIYMFYALWIVFMIIGYMEKNK